MRKILAISAVVMVVMLGMMFPALAQVTTPTQCPHQQACEIIDRAIQLGAQYGITPAQIDQLVPALVNQDMGAISAFLTRAGLSEQQQQELLTQAQPLLSAALSNPYLKQSIGALMSESMNSAGIPAQAQGRVVSRLNDDAALAAVLRELGLDDDGIAGFLEAAEYYGYSAAAFDTFLGAYAFAQTLQALGIDENTWDTFFDAYFGDPDTLESLFNEAGVDLDQAYTLWEDTYFGIFEDLGFDEDDLAAFSEAVFLDLLRSAAVYPDDLASLLALYGYDDDAIAAYLDDFGSLFTDLDLDPALLRGLLMAWADLGYDLDDLGLDADTFGMFLDMEDGDDVEDEDEDSEDASDEDEEDMQDDDEDEDEGEDEE